jgi:hypothetical protein
MLSFVGFLTSMESVLLAWGAVKAKSVGPMEAFKPSWANADAGMVASVEDWARAGADSRSNNRITSTGDGFPFMLHLVPIYLMSLKPFWN